MHFHSFLVPKWDRKSLVGKPDMPRIQDAIILATVNYKAVRPQNGQTPATFREASTEALAARAVLNMVTTLDSLQSSPLYRSSSSLVVPHLNSDGTPLAPNRYEIKTRINSQTATGDITAELAQFRAYVNSDEFADLIIGEAQF